MNIINCEIVERIGKESGKPFKVIEFTWSNGFKTLFFPNDDDQEIRLLMRMPG